ncbi:hypothetical protein J3E68DRAFT_84595 [Trichoderma sp. SZMC 28012]
MEFPLYMYLSSSPAENSDIEAARSPTAPVDARKYSVHRHLPYGVLAIEKSQRTSTFAHTTAITLPSHSLPPRLLIATTSLKFSLPAASHQPCTHPAALACHRPPHVHAGPSKTTRPHQNLPSFSYQQKSSKCSPQPNPCHSPALCGPSFHHTWSSFDSTRFMVWPCCSELLRAVCVPFLFVSIPVPSPLFLLSLCLSLPPPSLDST